MQADAKSYSVVYSYIFTMLFQIFFYVPICHNMTSITTFPCVNIISAHTLLYAKKKKEVQTGIRTVAAPQDSVELRANT